MFGFFKKKAPAGSFILVAVEAAVALRATEQRNGELYTPPELIMPTVKSIARKKLSFRRKYSESNRILRDGIFNGTSFCG